MVATTGAAAGFVVVGAGVVDVVVVDGEVLVTVVPTRCQGAEVATLWHPAKTITKLRTARDLLTLHAHHQGCTVRSWSALPDGPILAQRDLPDAVGVPPRAPLSRRHPVAVELVSDRLPSCPISTPGDDPGHDIVTEGPRSA